MGIFDRQPNINTDAAWARNEQRKKEQESARLEGERKNALAGSEDIGLADNDPDARTVAREIRVEKERGTIKSILEKIKGGF